MQFLPVLNKSPDGKKILFPNKMHALSIATIHSNSYQMSRKTNVEFALLFFFFCFGWIFEFQSKNSSIKYVKKNLLTSIRTMATQTLDLEHVLFSIRCKIENVCCCCLVFVWCVWFIWLTVEMCACFYLVKWKKQWYPPSFKNMHFISFASFSDFSFCFIDSLFSA